MTARPASRVFLCLTLWLAQIAAAGYAWAQAVAAPPESAVKAAFLFKFAGFVEWPAGVFQRPDQPLVIAVSGDDEVAADLEQLAAGRTLDGRPVTIRRLAEAGSSSGAHVLFLGSRRESRLKEAIESVTGPVLVVTEQTGGLKLGGVINFSTDQGRVRFSASLTAAEARKLRLSARLLAVAQSIEGRNP